MGKGEAKELLTGCYRILSESVEALIAGIHLHSGQRAAKEFINDVILGA